MLRPLLELYQLIDRNQETFITHSLRPIAFLDIYRSQPLEPELYEYFPLPAIFINYEMDGHGIRTKRLVTLNLHIITDEMPEASNISSQKLEGLNRFLYNLILQKILEGASLGKTTPLKFIQESTVDADVVNYHTQTYQFEAYLDDMLEESTQVIGEFISLRIFGQLVKSI